jgi:hypothetical protein
VKGELNELDECLMSSCSGRVHGRGVWRAGECADSLGEGRIQNMS